MASLDEHGILKGPLFDGDVDILDIAQELIDLRPGDGVGPNAGKNRAALAQMLVLYDIALSLRQIATAPAVNSLRRDRYEDKPPGKRYLRPGY